MQIPNRKIVVGNPAQIKGDVSDEMINGKRKERSYIKNYQKIVKH